MNVNFLVDMVDLDGRPIDEAEGKPATLGFVCLDALMRSYNDEPNLTGVEKVRRYDLALRIKRGGGQLDLPAEEITLLKLLIGKAYAPLIVGQAWAMLEGKV